MQKRRLDQFVSADDRAGAVRFFMTDIYGAPRPFVAVMPLVMRSAWKKKQVCSRIRFRTTLRCSRIGRSCATEACRSPSLLSSWAERRVPAPLKDAVATVAGALPNARRIYLHGQDHNVSAPAVAPVIADFFSTSARASAN